MQFNHDSVNIQESARSQVLRIRVDPATDEKQLRLCCPIHVKRLGEVTHTTETFFNNEGFYCTSDVPFVPGERLSCEISIPRAGEDVIRKSLELSCSVKVLRVELRGLKPGFGVAFLFESRKVVVE
jgi:hypothetical protein